MKEVNGFLWPDHDTECNKVTVQQSQSLDLYYQFCKDFRVAVQAGGNVGVWPKKMASKFGEVHTFEPAWDNFECLEKNVTEPNVIKHYAALGEAKKRAGIKMIHGNCGGNFLDSGDSVNVETVDGLNLEFLDFLVLDVGGAEILAIAGAMETIERCKPIIVTEEKGHCVRFGYKPGSVGILLAKLGYGPAYANHRDIVYVP